MYRIGYDKEVHFGAALGLLPCNRDYQQVATKPESTCVKSLPQLIAKFAEIV